MKDRERASLLQKKQDQFDSVDMFILAKVACSVTQYSVDLGNIVLTQGSHCGLET